jgi:hypothetical protein
MGRFTALLVSSLPVIAGCQLVGTSSAPQRDPSFPPVMSAVVGIILTPRGEGAGLELQQLPPALRTAASPGLVSFTLMVKDQDLDDNASHLDEPVAATCPTPASPPALPTNKPSLPDNPTSYQTNKYREQFAAWRVQAQQDHHRWLQTAQSQAAACVGTQAQELDARGKRLNPPGPEDVPGGPMYEQWDIAAAVTRANQLFASAAASPSVAVRVPILIVMANLGGFGPVTTLPPSRGLRVVLANFNSSDASPTQGEAWRQGFLNVGAVDVKVLDSALTESTLPGIVTEWLRAPS